VLHPGTAVWIEETCGSLHNVDDIPTLPDIWLPYQESRFIHIETRIMTSSISNLISYDLTGWSLGSYAAFQINRITWYARVYPLGSYTSVYPTQYTGLTLPSALSGLTNMYRVLSFISVLIVEDKGDFCERVGVVHIYFNTDRYKWWRI
jgi:hypothetical protein